MTPHMRQDGIPDTSSHQLGMRSVDQFEIIEGYQERWRVIHIHDLRHHTAREILERAGRWRHGHFPDIRARERLHATENVESGASKDARQRVTQSPLLALPCHDEPDPHAYSGSAFAGAPYSRCS